MLQNLILDFSVIRYENKGLYLCKAQLILWYPFRLMNQGGNFQKIGWGKTSNLSENQKYAAESKRGEKRKYKKFLGNEIFSFSFSHSVIVTDTKV